MRNNYFKKIGLSAMLLICVLGSSLLEAQNPELRLEARPNSGNYQNTAEEVLPVSSGQSPFESVKGLKEDIRKRDAYSRHYINEDGSFTAIIGAGPIHYEKNGQFLNIDHRIKLGFDSNYPYSNTTNLFESYFGATSDTGIKNKTKEGEIREFLNTQMYWEVNGQAVNAVHSSNRPVSIDGDKAYYHNLYGNISAEFTTLTGKRKLNYIIPNQQALGSIPSGADYLVFTEDVILPFGWTSQVSEQGVSILNPLGQTIYLYENPVSTDAVVDELQAQGNTVFETFQLGNTLTIKTKVKTAWLLSSERQFPVMVDPTTEVRPDNGTNWTRTVRSNGGNLGTLYFGLESNTWLQGSVKFNTSSIPTNNVVVNSVVGYINISAGTGTNPQTRQWQFSNSADPTTTSGIALYNSMTLGYSQIVSVVGLGWRSSSLYNPEGNEYVRNSLANGYVSLGIYPSGTYNNNTYMTVNNHTAGTNRPYLVINWEPISADRTLTVSEAYTGASYANGSHTLTNNTSVTATAGTRSGYIVTGWTGTGSVPATGTGGSATFTITENSTINWLWEQTGTPREVLFYNYGGDDQLAFNNSRIDTNTPTFRLSHGTYDATDYQLEINSSPDFTGTSWNQTFTGTYPLNTEANFTFTNAFTPVNGTTYYVRARVKGAADVWSAWTADTYSFTYQNPQETPDWFQTTQAQFSSDVLSGVTANAGGNVVVSSGSGNPFTNPSFESGLTGWNSSSNWPSIYVAQQSSDWASNGSFSLVMFNNNPGGVGYFVNDYISTYQTVNLSGVSNLLMDVDYWGQGTVRTAFRVVIADVGQETGTAGIQVVNWTPTSNTTNNLNIDISSYGFSGNKVVKLIYYVISQETGTNNTKGFWVDHIRTISPPTGTITSTPIHLASVQDAEGYEGITWNQTLSGGNMTLKVQRSADGISGWTDAPAPYNAITATGDGLQTFDLSEMEAYPHIRLVGDLNGADVTLHDWSVQFQAEPEDCSVETIWDGATWSNNVPDSSIYKIIFEGDYDSDSDPAYPVATGLVGCSVEVRQNAEVVISAGHSVTIDNEITVDDANGASFTIKPDANLVQINAGVPNAGKIIVEQSADVPSNQYNYWAFPVKQQQLYTIYTGIPNNRIMRYNPQTDYFITIPNNPSALSVFGKGYSIKGPISNYPLNQDGGTEVTATFTGVPNNQSLDGEENKITVATFDNDGNFNLIGNPFPSNLDLAQFYDKDDDLLTGNADKFLTADAYFWDNVGNTEMTQQGSGYNQSNYALYNMQSGIGTAAPCTAIQPNTCTTGSNKRPNGIVKPGQGFIVNIKQNETFLTVNNAMRTTQTLKGGHEAVYFKNGKMPPANDTHERDDKFWLELINSNETHIEIAIGYFEEAEDTFEIYDSEIMSESVSDNLYTLSNDAVKLAINGRKGIFSDEDVIPLGVKFFVNGKYRIQLEDTKGIFVHYQKIYLKDKHLGIIHNLSEDGPYEIDGIAGEYIDRFEIIFKDGNTESGPVLTTASDNHLKINKRENQIEISSSRDKILEVEIFNLSGWSVYKNEKVNSKLLSVPATFFGKQIIVVKVLTETGEIVTKSIINK